MVSDKVVGYEKLLDDVPWYREALILKYIFNVGWAICLCRVLENLTYHSSRGNLECWRFAD